MNNSIRDKWCEKEISDLDYIRHLEAENAKLKEPKTCETCVKNKGCKIMAFMFRDRLNKEGYAMYRNEMLCLHFYEQKEQQ